MTLTRPKHTTFSHQTTVHCRKNKNVKQPNFRMEARVVTWRKNGKILPGQEPRYHPSFAQINYLLDNIFLSATYQTLTGTEQSTDIISGTRGLG